jgi:hypothetical protein
MVSVSFKPLQYGGKNLHFHYHKVGDWAIPHAPPERSGGNPICRGSKHSSARSQVVVLMELSRLRWECWAYTDVRKQLQYNHPAHSYLQDRQILIVATQTIPVRTQTLV